MNISDMIIQLYAAESTMLRVEKLFKMKEESDEVVELDDSLNLNKMILNVNIYDAADRIYKAGADAINSFTTGKRQQLLLTALTKFTRVAPVNVKEARNAVAEKLIEDNSYKF